MPSHEEDLPLMPNIQNTITNQINGHPDHTYILCRDFNRDVALIGKKMTNKPDHHNPKITNGEHSQIT